MPAEIMAPSASSWRADLERRQRCEIEGHPAAVWLRRIYANGSGHIEFFCETCDRPVTRDQYGTPGHAVSVGWFVEVVGKQTGATIEQLPEHRRSLRFHLCYLCGVTAQCEFHHVAPQALYGKAAEKYPIVPLCLDCHDAATREFTEFLEAWYCRRRERERRGERQRQTSEAAD